MLRFRRMLSLVAQLALVVLSNRLAFWLRFDNAIPDWANQAFWQMLPWLIVIRGVAFIPFRLYEGLWRYTSIYDLQALIGGIASSSFVFFILTRTPLGPPTYPRSIFIIDALILTVLLGGMRMTRRFYAGYTRVRPGRRVLIFGAGDAGELIVRDMKKNAWYGVQPIGFIDDDRSKLGRRIHNVPVLGTRNDLTSVLERYHPDEVLPRATTGAEADARGRRARRVPGPCRGPSRGRVWLRRCERHWGVAVKRSSAKGTECLLRSASADRGGRRGDDGGTSRFAKRAGHPTGPGSVPSGRSAIRLRVAQFLQELAGN